ncbi:HAD-IB family hydrolase [Stakelama sp. CBK3Z-3]|uniref:HAD-IB family hydrolase n=1 Tax=Stakelama flava TaxID=2860338 RepID=A0ABS6XIQ5_9SPHN|nr:HAD-IB family hydrolase [Stakelama flava]MBW4330057.1 HAD-IB family hydrolase [Stakelama flava]
MRYLAIYDMDRTITREPTWTPFLIHAARRIAPWRLALAPFVVGGGIAYKLNLISRGQLKQFTQRLILGTSIEPGTRTRLAEAFADTIDESGILKGARERIAEDRQAGYELVLATASYRFYASAIAGKLGFDAVIATESRFAEDGDLLPKIEGENCYGEAKLTMIKAWMAREDIRREEAHVRFYSDHVSDAPALEWADEPFAANPHDALRRLAARREWPVLDWRG